MATELLLIFNGQMGRSSSKKLIWFQHLHKAGGTTIVELAKANGLKLYPRNANGNPLDKDGTVIPLWERSPAALASWISECLANEIEFVATEWGCPVMEALVANDKVHTLIVIRQPFDRFLSNYNFSSLYSATNARSPYEYADSGPLHACPNYYTRILSRQMDTQRKLSYDHLTIALQNLALFDLCVVLELRETFKLLGEALGWHKTYGHANKLRYPWRHKIRLAATGEISAATRNLTGRTAKATPELEDWFNERNEMDVHLYQAARGKALILLADHLSSGLKASLSYMQNNTLEDRLELRQ